MQSIPQRFIVVGGGLAGIAAAYLLAQRGRSVTLLERSPMIGGALRGSQWNGLSLDLGYHVFANENDTTTSLLLELLYGEATPVEVRAASVINGVCTTGVELPDLRQFGDATSRAIVFEVARAAAAARKAEAPQSLQQHVSWRYGPTTTHLLAPPLHKIFVTDPDELAPEAAYAAPIRRILCAPEDVAQVLKQSPLLDDRVAAASPNHPMRLQRIGARQYPYRAFYPKSGGIAGFVERAGERLRAAGVHIRTEVSIKGMSPRATEMSMRLADGSHVESDVVVWTAGLSRLDALCAEPLGLESLIHDVPMVRYYFEVASDQLGKLTHLYDYDAQDHVFCAYSPLSYGGPAIGGRSYVCAEVRTTTQMPAWKSAHALVPRIWEELLRHQVVTHGQPRALCVDKTTVCQRVPKRGYAERVGELRARLSNEPRLAYPDEFQFCKVKTAQAAIQLVDRLAPANDGRRAA